MTKKLMAMLLAALLLLSTATALGDGIVSIRDVIPIADAGVDAAAQSSASELVYSPVYGGRTPEEAYEELIVGSTTMLSGDFFDVMWGNNTADIDVQDLIHGYNLVFWDMFQGMYSIDTSIVSGATVTEDAEGNKTYTISIVEGLTYNDGTPINARDYVFSLLLRNSQAASELGASRGFTEYIQGAAEFRSGASETLSGVRLLSDDTFTIVITSDYLPFFFELSLLQVLPYPISVIAPECEVADDGNGAYIRNIDPEVLEPIFTTELLAQTILNPEIGYRSHPSLTSGPYTLVNYDEVEHVASFEINPYYAGDNNGQKPSIQRLVYLNVTNEEAAQMLERGEIDLFHKATNRAAIDEALAYSQTTGLLRASNYPRSGLTLISFCCEKGPTQFELTRQAIAMCFDRDEFIARLVGDYGMGVDGYYGVGQWMVQLVNGTLAPPVKVPAEGATAEETLAYETELDEWATLSLDVLATYPLDVAAAEALLIEDGWVLNESGEPFEKGRDELRAKLVDDEIIPLDMTLILPKGNQAAQLFDAMLCQNLARVGAKLTVEEQPFDKLLEMYYRVKPRECDMFYLGTNFMLAFDPTLTYGIADEHQGVFNVTGLREETLEWLAMEMHKTEMGDILGYCKKWVDFQMFWSQVLPAIPVYSNIYFDFYVDRLQNYQIPTYETWPQAIMYAYLGDAMDDEAEFIVDDEDDWDDETIVIIY